MCAARGAATALAGRLTAEIMETLKSVDLSQAVAARYAELQSQLTKESAARSIERASDVEQQLRDLLRSPSFLIGQWAGAADLAAQARESSFFSSSYGMRYIKSAVPADRLSTDDADAIRQIDARLREAQDDRAFDDVHTVLQKLIRRRGS